MVALKVFGEDDFVDEAGVIGPAVLFERRRQVRELDFRVAADDDRDAEVSGVAPAPDGLYSHEHERRDHAEKNRKPESYAWYSCRLFTP